jgi:ABC-2 type transport system ATP-binding protein
MFINITNVSKSFKTVKAVKNVSLQIPQGTFLGLLGPNGAGKTTMVEMIEGIQHPDSGTIKIDNKTWAHHSKELIAQMGICLQETQYMEKVTVAETIALFADIYKAAPQKITSLINHFGLKENQKQYVTNLSGGQRQKLSLLLALINEPQILILDEPTTGLDPHIRREIWELLLGLKKQGLTLILTTHYMEEAELLCDQIILMNQGTIIKQGTISELLKTLGTKHKIIIDVKEKDRLPDFTATKLAKEITWDPKTRLGTIFTDEPANNLSEILDLLKAQNFTINRLDIKHNNLEDVFIYLTGETLNV